MIPGPTVSLIAGALYVLCGLGFVVWFQRTKGRARTYCAAAMVFIGLGAVSHLLSGLEIGTVSLAGGLIDLPSLTEDLITYTGVFVLVGLLAGASKQLLAALGGTMLFVRLVFELPNSGLVDGTGALLSAGIVIAGYLVIVMLFLRPIWAAAQQVSPRQRLLHWKCRNLVLFLFGVLLVYAILAVTGLFDPFVLAVLNAHIDFLIRVGTAALLFANMDELHETDVDRTTPVSPAAGGAESHVQ